MIEEILAEAEAGMDAAIRHVREEFVGVRTGRATPALVEKLPVDYCGASVPLQQLAGFSVPEARVLVISPYDKGAMGAIERAIRESDLGLNPSNDGQVIRLVFPPLTEERRKELVKLVRHMAEQGKVSIRNHRRHARELLHELAREGEASEDEVARAEKMLDKLTHEKEAEVDEALQHKEQELLEV